jgi:hypothetical protein
VQPRRSNHQGYVMVFMAITLGLFLSFAAAAIDMGNIYLWKLRLDKAARAGVLSGLGYRSLKGWQTIYGGEPQFNGSEPLRKNAALSSEMQKLLTGTNQVVIDNLQASFPPGTTSRNMEDLKPTTPDYATVLQSLPNDAYNPVTDELEVSYQYDVPTFLVGRASKMLGFNTVCGESQGTKCRVTTTQRAQLDYANIILLLDLSGSMNCNVGDSNCACRNTGTCGAPGTTRVLDILRPAAVMNGSSALEHFYKMFNPFRDRISVIPFNMAATVSFGFLNQQTNGPQSFGANQEIFGNGFKRVISSLTATSNTNPCDAFAQAIGQTNTLFTALQGANPTLQQQDMRPFVVLFSDGAPNAMRGVFQNLTDAANTAINTNNLPNDWYHFALEWAISRNTSTETYTGPAPLVNAAGSSLFNFTPTHQVLRPAAAQGAANLPCGDVWFNKSATDTSQPFFQAALDSSITVPPGRNPGCLTPARGSSNMQNFFIPNTQYQAGVLGVPPNFESPNAPGEIALTFDHLPYYCTIEAADYLRQIFGATVFSIGLGNPDINVQSCPDPFQNAADSFVRKDNFLARVAFDPDTVGPTGFLRRYDFSTQGTVAINQQNCPDHPHINSNMPIGYTSALGVTGPASLGQRTQGRFYGTNVPGQLPLLFSQVAKQILLRLTS